MKIIHIVTGLVLASGIAGHGVGQTRQAEPLKCDKYQHIDTACYADMEHGGCLPPKCIDDMHQVTEREWQTVLADQEHLQKALDHLLSALDHQANFNDKIIHALEKVAK